jgi:hypothetical protein
MGVVTGQGLMGLIRDRYGPRYGGACGDRRGVGAGARWPLPPDRALSAGPGGSVRGLYRGRLCRPSRLGTGRDGATCAAHAADRRGDRHRHGHGRHDACSLGAQLHPVVRGRQKAHCRGPAVRARGCDHRVRTDRSHWPLRDHHLRRHPARTRPPCEFRRRRRRSPCPLSGTVRSRPLRDRHHRCCDPCQRHIATVHRLFD